MIARAIYIGGHGCEISSSILSVVRPAHLDSGNFGDRIRSIRGLERAGQQVLFTDGLEAELGVDATRSKKKQPVDTSGMTGFYDVTLNVSARASAWLTGSTGQG